MKCSLFKKFSSQSYLWDIALSMYNTQIHVIYMTLAFIMHIYISEVLDFLKKKKAYIC